MRQFIAVGNCVIDTILRYDRISNRNVEFHVQSVANGGSIPHFIAEDDKIRAFDLTRRRGGNSANLSDVLGQLFEGEDKQNVSIGLNLVVVLPSRSSPAVQEILQSLGPSINTAHCIHREESREPSSSYIIKNLASGSRSIISYNALADMTFDEFKLIAAHMSQEAPWFHFEVSLCC
jgi:ketohexokinase